jgi:hypothetical protein
MDKTTENLLRELEGSPTDLKRLVVSAVWRYCSAIAIESEAITRWERETTRSAGRRFENGSSARASRSRC